MALAAPAVADLPTTGAWIFPHERQAKVIDGNLGEFYYNTTSNDAWIADAFFADSDADGASVQVDFHNPTQGELDNVILWVAVNDYNLFTSVDISGGSSGALHLAVDDLSGGTPTTNAPLPDFVYPAHYGSYGIGKLTVGEDGIVTATLNVTGDFQNGLVLRLDYTATDASGTDVSGPFEGGMTIYEWGDLPADEVGPVCPEEGGLKLEGDIDADYTGGSIDIDAALTLVPTFEYEASNVVVTLNPGSGLSIATLPGGTIQNGIGTVALPSNVTKNVTISGIVLEGSPLLLDGDVASVDVGASWDGCDGGGQTSSLFSLEIELAPSGQPETASYWAKQIKEAIKGHGNKADYSAHELMTLLESIALHSDVFTFGGDDMGAIDISDIEQARDILQKSGRGHGVVKETQQELLALWLNIASGALNLDSELKLWKHHLGRMNAADEGAGLPATVGEVVATAESALADYFDADEEGSHGSHWWHKRAAVGMAVWVGGALCGLVNSGWLRVV